MNILLYRKKSHEDYLYDSLLHGLRQLEDVDVVDEPYISHMYKDNFGEGKRTERFLYGKGFSLFASLPEVDVDRNDIKSKVRNNYYDYILVDIENNPFTIFDDIDLLDLPRNKIIIIDGRDERHVDAHAVEHYQYFKRELIYRHPNLYSLPFSIPKEQILNPIEKIKTLAHVRPGDMSTYIFNDPESYFKDYNESLFGITMCKYGWDCMRHYEIFAARSIPWFVDIDACPELSCTTLPKKDLSRMNRLITNYGVNSFMEGIGREIYEEMRQKMFDHFVNNCTTEANAKYFIESLRK